MCVNMGIVHRCRDNFYSTSYFCTDNILDYQQNVKENLLQSLDILRSQKHQVCDLIYWIHSSPSSIGPWGELWASKRE